MYVKNFPKGIICMKSRVSKIPNSGGLKWIIKNSKKQIPAIIIVTFFYCILAFIGVYNALISKSVVDSAINGNMNGVILYGITFAAIIFIQLLLRIVTRSWYFKIGSRLTIHYRQIMFNTLLKKDYYSLSKYHSGELINRITNDIAVVADMVTSLLPSLSFMLTKLIGALAVLFAIDWRFTIVFVAGALLLFVITRLFRGKMKSLHKKAQEADGKVMSFMQEVLSSLLVVKVFGAEGKTSKKCGDLQQNSYKIKLKRNFISVVANTGFSFIFSLGYLYGLLWGSVSIVNHVITFGTLTAILSLVSQIQGPVSELSSLLPKYYGAVASAERLMELEALDNDVKINDTSVNREDVYKNLKSIEFDSISFSYDRDIVLDNTSFSLNKGDFLVIMGISGIGKSTLTKLLMGVYPLEKGEIYLQLNNNEKIYVDKSTRHMFAYVPQGNFLLSGTIRENIAFVYENAKDEEIMEAAKIACADTFIKELPLGLDTVIGEKGQGLSEGQVQRIAIARAILCASPVLIFDEATSALDENTEKQMLNNLKSLNNRTCIIISHKNAALDVCNRCVKIVDGKIVEDGNVTE